jgi:hypothetical protein
MALPFLHGHNRSSTVSFASAEHGTSTGTWEGAPSEWSPRGVYSPVLARGSHGRTERCIWALVSQRGAHEALPRGGLCLVLTWDTCGGPARWLGNLRRVSLLRTSHEKAKHQRPQEVT